ncbi:MAG: LutC/YkgG family protein [Anaerolineae bacterium]
MSSRDHILKQLRRAQQPFTDVAPIKERRKVVNLSDTSMAGLQARFITEAEKLHCHVHEVTHDAEALDQLLALVGDASPVLMWDDAHLPFPIAQVLRDNGIEIAPSNSAQATIGITGISVALAGTGSLVLSSGQGRARSTSLLPDQHIALVRADQLIADFETWIAQERENGNPAFTASSNTVIISGPSKTADIAQELIEGAHGPRRIDVILIAT